MKILLFGGSFDPPHIGHKNLLAQAIEAVRPHSVIVVPAGIAPHKSASATPAFLRSEMCECFAPLHERVQVSGIEIERSGKSYTIDTVEQLQKEYENAELYLCIGADMLESFPHWYCWQELLQKVTIVAAGRLPHQEEQLQKAAMVLERQGGRVLFADGAVQPAASSDIRTALQNGDKKALKLVPAPADEVIKNNLLYSKRPIDAQQAKKLAKRKLSRRRYEHTKGVVSAAGVLAKRFGADEGRAELAAWLHDIVKEYSYERLLQLLAQDDIIAQSTKQRPKKVWHAPAAAVYAKHVLGVQDEEVLQAVALHTTGAAGMSVLDKVIFLADYISEERCFEGVAQVRALAEQELNAAMRLAMQQVVEQLRQGGMVIDTHTAQALQELCAEQ